MRLLRSVVRRRIVRPDALLESVRPVLIELEELLGALGAELVDERWTEAAKKLGELVEVLKKPSEYYKHVRDIDAARELVKGPAIRFIRKGQAWARLRRRA